MPPKTDQDADRTILNTNEILSTEELLALCQRIVDSGILGRSRYCSALLRYLVQCALSGKSPREIDLAIDVLKRNSDFDVSNDASVRVHVYQLRKKLDNYYESYEHEANYRIVIPKGQYKIALQKKTSISVDSPAHKGIKQRLGLNNALLLAAVILLTINLAYMTITNQSRSPVLSQIAATHPIWDSVLQDELPILLVMGDYYIFGELNSSGNIARMVREFNVNSSLDLERMQFTDFERAENYLDLNLSYMPEGSAFALARIVPILEESNKIVNITMMSDLTTSDLRENHIVYIGYISGLEKLNNVAFASSGLRLGRSYDELLNSQTLEYYTSDAGLPEEGELFKDYGMFSTFPISTKTQILLISGMRDAGLMHTAQALSDPEALDDLIAAIDNDTDEAPAGFEALYEVFGIDRMNFNAKLIHTKILNIDKIWANPDSIK